MPIYNSYPAPYPNPYYTQPPSAQPSTGIIWVSGEAGAKAYMVAPNTTVQLWDSESQTIYLRSADAAGMPSMKVLDYTIRDNTAPAKEPAYASKKDIDALHDEIDSINDRIDGLLKKKKREVEDDE